PVASLPLVLDREVTGIQVPVSDLCRQLRILGAAAVKGLRAPRPEAAPLRPVDERRRLAGDCRPPARLRPGEAGDRSDQPPGLGMLRVVEDLLLVALLDDPACV